MYNFIKKIKRQIEILKLNRMELKDLEIKLNFLKEFHFRFQIANIGLPLAQEAVQNQKEEIKLLETIINKKRSGGIYETNRNSNTIKHNKLFRNFRKYGETNFSKGK